MGSNPGSCRLLLIYGSTASAPRRVAESESKTELSPTATLVSGAAAPAATRHLSQMVLATTAVVVLPLAASLALRASGLISSPWLSVALTVGLSLAASSAGSAYWRKRAGVGELLFSELLVWGWVRRWRHERELANAAELLSLAISHGAARDEALTTERREELLRQLARALEGQDLYLSGHSRRVARHATMIARGLGLPTEQVAQIRAAAAVHDVGKLLTPKAILNKPDRLTDAEFDVIKRHPVDSAEMVAALGDQELTRIVRHHHERLDGAGYPDRLAGEQIPLGARIIAVADTFDAITSARAYRAAARHQKAIDILRAEAGSQLDPEAVRAFLTYYSGKRPTAMWALATESLRRVVCWLSGNPAAAATISTGKLAAATAATVAIGAAAAGAPVPVVHASRAHAVARNAAPARPGPTAVRGPVASAALGTADSTRSAPGRVIRRARGRAHGAAAHATAAQPARHAVRSGGHASAATDSRPAGSPSAGSPSASAPSAGVPNAASTNAAASTPTTTTGAGPTRTTTAAPVATAPTRSSSTSTSTATVQPLQPTSPGRSQNGNGNGNGNAYGHDNTHSNAGGNGNGNGHTNQNSQKNGTAALQTATPTTTTTAPPTQTTTTAPTQTTTATTPAVQSTTGNGKAKGKASS